jgi:hypothetical protein
MRFSRGLLAGLIAAGLVGCSSSGTLLPPISPSSTPHAKTAPAAVTGGPAEPRTKAGARAAAAHFYGLYFRNQFAASWDLVAPAAKSQIPRSVWVAVHDGCPSTSRGRTKVIKSVTLFGDTAIVTERAPGTRSERGKSADVFNYTNGHWGYSPGNPGIYHHGSVAADIVAAKAVGLCARQKAGPL